MGIGISEMAFINIMKKIWRSCQLGNLERAFIQPFESLKLVNAAVEGMRKLHGPMPEELDD